MLLVNNLCRQAILQKNMTLQSSGQQQRNFITMTDACNAIKYLLYIHKMNLGNGVFNVGGVFNYSILGMTQMIQKRLQHITGDLIKIIYKESARTCNIDKFEYRIDKLLGTGFSLVNNIEKEIDQLIYFCINNFR